MSLRVCFVSPHIYGYFNSSYGYTGGGAERQFYLLSTALADRFDVHVIVGDYGQPAKEIREGVTLHRSYPLNSRQHPLQPIKHLLLLTRAMWRADADVYLHRGRPRNAALIYLVSRLLRRKWVYHVANDASIWDPSAVLSESVRLLFRCAIDGASAVIAQTDRQRDLLSNNYRKDATVIPNGYPTASKSAPYSERKYFLWVGSLDKDQKRPHLFLNLAEQMPEQTFRLVAPCNEPNEYQQSLKHRANALENVKFVGSVPPDEIHTEYKHAIAFVNTSAYEGFPNTFLEAWRQGTPVVSLDIDPRRFLPLDFGYVDGDLGELKGTLRQIADDVSFRREVGTRSLKQFESSLSLSVLVERYTKILEQICHR